MHSKAFIFFLADVIIIVAIVSLSVFWDDLGLGGDKGPLGFITLLIFPIALSGFIVACAEKKNALTWIGLIGNLVVILVFIFLITIFVNDIFSLLAGR
jgi:hypothetical protein